MARVGLGGARGSQETPLFCPGKGLQGRLSGGTRGWGLDGDLSRGVIGTGGEGETGVRGQRSWTSLFGPFIPWEVRSQGLWEKSRGCRDRAGVSQTWAPDELFSCLNPQAGSILENTSPQA